MPFSEMLKERNCEHSILFFFFVNLKIFSLMYNWIVAY